MKKDNGTYILNTFQLDIINISSDSSTDEILQTLNEKLASIKCKAAQRKEDRKRFWAQFNGNSHNKQYSVTCKL